MELKLVLGEKNLLRIVIQREHFVILWRLVSQIKKLLYSFFVQETVISSFHWFAYDYRKMVSALFAG